MDLIIGTPPKSGVIYFIDIIEVNLARRRVNCDFYSPTFR